VRWFYADRGAKIFPQFHLFASATWEVQRASEFPLPPYDGPGEERPELYAHDPLKGVNIHGALGVNYCGSLEVYQRGQTADDPTGPRAADGHPPCCVRPTQTSNVGVVIGAAVRPFPGFIAAGTANGDSTAAAVGVSRALAYGTAYGDSYALGVYVGRWLAYG